MDFQLSTSRQSLEDSKFNSFSAAIWDFFALTISDHFNIDFIEFFDLENHFFLHFGPVLLKILHLPAFRQPKMPVILDF